MYLFEIIRLQLESIVGRRTIISEDLIIIIIIIIIIFKSIILFKINVYYFNRNKNNFILKKILPFYAQ